MTASLLYFLSAPEGTYSHHFIEYDSRDFLPVQCQCIYYAEASMTVGGEVCLCAVGEARPLRKDGECGAEPGQRPGLGVSWVVGAALLLVC